MTPAEYRPALWGSDNPASKVTNREREAMRARRAQGETLASIAADYPISLQSVYAIVGKKQHAPAPSAPARKRERV